MFTWAGNPVSPTPFDFSCNLNWKSCQNCSAHPPEPHLCPILLPGSTAPPPLQNLCLSFTPGTSALYSALALCIHRDLLSFRWTELSKGLTFCSLSSAPSWWWNKESWTLLCCPQEPLVLMEVFSESRFQPAAVETSSVS